MDMLKANRRALMMGGLAIGGCGALAIGGISRCKSSSEAGRIVSDIVAVKGADTFASTFRAVEALGGIARFVPKRSRVGLLINAPPNWKLEGSHTRMEVALAVAKMCFDAGAREVVTLPVLGPRFWTDSPLAEAHAALINSIKPCSGTTVDKAVPQGVHLKSGKTRPELLDVDILINLPIAKHHAGTQFSGNLKNMMGGLVHETNLFFHSGTGKNDVNYEDVEFLSQCIVDLNTLRRPNLCVVDATVVLGSNGPVGPGDLRRPQKVVAGADSVAVDAYCVTLHDRRPEDVVMLTKAVAAGIGRADLHQLKIQEIAI
jgi:uncharacterized protein (DUF362 family)